MLLTTLQSEIDSISINPNDYPTQTSYEKAIALRNELIAKIDSGNYLKQRKQLTQKQIEWIENEYLTNPDLILFRESGNEDVNLSNYLSD